MDVTKVKDHPRFGSFAAIGLVCGVSRAAVRKWKRVPAEYCRAIEKATEGALTRYQLRPDVFGAAPGDEREAA